MEQELVIKIPQGYKFHEERDGQIILRTCEDKSDYPSDWGECLNKLRDSKINYINGSSEIKSFNVRPKDIHGMEEFNLHPAEYSEALLALNRLLICYKAWIRDWKIDWEDSTQNKFCIIVEHNVIKIATFTGYNRTLAFPTFKMAFKFLNDFNPLIKRASILL
jgi:hypothetical protein